MVNVIISDPEATTLTRHVGEQALVLSIDAVLADIKEEEQRLLYQQEQLPFEQAVKKERRGYQYSPKFREQIEAAIGQLRRLLQQHEVFRAKELPEKKIGSVILAMREGIENAVMHGNCLDIRLPIIAQAKILVRSDVIDDEIEMSVTDRGSGFKAKNLPSTDLVLQQMGEGLRDEGGFGNQMIFKGMHFAESSQVHIVSHEGQPVLSHQLMMRNWIYRQTAEEK